MKSNLKILSLLAFILSIPALIIVDWFYSGYGILVMFILLSIGVVCDQLIRMKFPKNKVIPLHNYRANRVMNIFAVVLFLLSPMALIYGNRVVYRMGFWLMAIMICLGIVFNQIARIVFPYELE
ncbi:putative membrane protein [Clostridium bornimense]|uniref:Putative membrane protein n=1 Tax=Clostridium bornimense TaxID=1216932 RepID=W6RVR3_9CLOT|nr:hypothetical protein [Clostridium bornimense]CDM68403.1 putative membrane protein [Clostridium bornimense]